MIYSVVEEKKFVGMTGTEVFNIIRSEHPELEVRIVSPKAIITADYKEDRLNIFVNDENIFERIYEG